MGTGILVISILVPTLSALALSFFLGFYWFSHKVKVVANKSGTLIYVFDPKTRSYKMSDSGFDQRPYFRRERFSGWKRINEIYSNVVTEGSDRKVFREVLQKIDKGIDYVDFTVKKQITKNKRVDFTFAFYKDVDSDYYTCTESWKTLNNKKRFIEKKWEAASEEGIISRGELYKGFVAFNLNPAEVNSDKKILEIISNLNLRKSIFSEKYKKQIIVNGNLIMILEGKNKKKIRKKINKFTKRFDKAKTKALGNRFYTGSAVAYTKNVTTKKTLYKMYGTLEFLLNKSIGSGKQFVSHLNNLDKDEFNSFAEASRIFRSAVKEGEVDFKEKSVRYWSTNKKITTYIKPEIKALNQTMIDNISRNTNNKNKLVDSIAKSIGIDEKIKSPVLVDVRADWLIKNQANITYKKAIYVISYNQNRPTDELREVVSSLRKKGFVFAIKIKKYNEDVSLLLEHLEPQFLVISKWMKDKDGLYDSKTLLNLVMLSNICGAKKIKIIYDNPPTILDKEITEKIGLKFYYK